jgi:hypothetical protein
MNMKSLHWLAAAAVICIPLWADNDDKDPSSGNFKAALSGYEEVLPVWTSATGDVTISVDTSAAKITVTMKYSNLSSAPVAAHLHWGPAGVSGPVILTLCGAAPNVCPANGAAASTFTYTAQALAAVAAPAGLTGYFPAANLTAFIDALQHGAIYANVHTQSLPNGEIRGQVGHGKSGGVGNGPPDNNPGKGHGPKH